MMPPLKLNMQIFNPLSCICKLLSPSLKCSPARTSVLQARFRKARKAALRVRCAPLNLEEKSQLVTGAASSLAIYGLETCPIGDGALRSLRSAVAMAIWGLQRRFRSVHAVLLLFSQSHLTDLLLRSVNRF